MSTVADTTQTHEGAISGGVAPDGSDVTVDGVVLTVIVPSADVAGLLFSYTPGSTISTATAQTIAAAVLDALDAFTP